MEQNDGPSRPKTAYEQVMEELEKQRRMAEMMAAQNSGAFNSGGLVNQGVIGHTPLGGLFASGAGGAGAAQVRAYQDGSGFDTVQRLGRENAELRHRISILEKMLAHPDWRTINSIDSLIQGVETQEVYRAGAPFTAKQVFAEVVKGGAVPDVIKLIDREGRQSNAVVSGITIVTGNPEAPVAYYLTNIKMAEMNKKQVIADLVASIIEDRVMENIEER